MEKEKRKRERNVNYSPEETEILIELVEERISVIENKKSDAATWQKKEEAWKEIENEFNSAVGGVYRDSKHLRIKYDAIKRDTRKKAALLRTELSNVDSNTPRSLSHWLTPLEEKVKDMIFLSVDGEESSNPTTCTLKTKNHPTLLSKPREKKSFDRLAEAKIELSRLQRQLIVKDIQQKEIQRKIYQQELDHKREMHKLEKEHLLIKIEITKTELENAKQKNV